MVVSADELNTLCAEWQDRLRLGDWNLGTRKSHKIEDNKAAHVEWFKAEREARIEVLHEDAYPDNCMLKQDMERDIVHELLHLVLIEWDCEEHYGPQEWAINQIASALVALKRKDDGKESNP